MSRVLHERALPLKCRTEPAKQFVQRADQRLHLIGQRLLGQRSQRVDLPGPHQLSHALERLERPANGQPDENSQHGE